MDGGQLQTRKIGQRDNYRITWFVSQAASKLKQITAGAEAKYSTQSARIQNEPSFGHKRLSERVLLQIGDILRRKLLLQRTSTSASGRGKERN